MIRRLCSMYFLLQPNLGVLYVGEKTGRFWHLKNQHLLQRIDPFPPPLLLIAYSSSRKYPTKFLMLLIDLCCLKNRSRGCDFGVGAGANIGQFFLRRRARGKYKVCRSSRGKTIVILDKETERSHSVYCHSRI